MTLRFLSNDLFVRLQNGIWGSFRASRTLSDKKKIIKITWDSGLQISKGDEVEILRGIVYNEGNIRASLMRNITTGRKERSRIEGVMMTRSPTDIVPPIKGIVQGIEARSNETKFDLVVGVGVIEVGLGKLLKEASKFLDKDIVDKCIYKKDAEDIVTSAFRILEERVRAKIGASPECIGVDLMNEAFHYRTGKLVFGKTEAEREGLFLLFRSSILFLRNPPSHRFIREYSEFEIFEMVCLVNLLLNILEKSQVRTEQPKKPKATAKKPSQKLEKKARQKEYPIGVVDEVYGPLYGAIKSIVLPLEDTWHRQINFDVWRAMQYDERHFMVDEKFGQRLDRFLERLEKYSSAIARLRNEVLPNIVNEEAERIFKVKTEGISLRTVYKKAKGLMTTSPNIVECLISQTHPKDDALKDARPESEIVEFQILFGQVPASSTIVGKFDEFWDSCLRRMKKDNTYNFVIEENDKLLEEAKNLEKEIGKRIQESLKI